MIESQGARRWAQALIGGAAMCAAACSDRTPGNLIGSTQRARMSIAPRFALVEGGPTIPLSRVDSWMILPTQDSLFQTAKFVSGSAALVFDVPIDGASLDVVLDVTGFDAGGIAIYHARQPYTIKPGDNSDLAQPEFAYTAPDAAVTSLVVSPKSTSVDAGSTTPLTVAGFGANQQSITPLNVGWTTRNANVATVDGATGVVTGVARGQTYIVARTATNKADSTLVSVVGFGITPDKVEKLPNGTQQFTATAARGTLTWTVNGVAGGNSTFGTVTSTGLYTAPATVPTPATFNVCAAQATPAANACAAVTINPVPTAGADVIVFNDMNLWDNTYGFPQGGANQGLFVVNIINFTGSGSRASQRGFLFYRGHGSLCAGGECSAANDSRMADTLTAHGYTVLSDTNAAITQPIDPTVKVFLILTPSVPFTNAEINILKQFASEGGRIVYSGEHGSYYGSYVGPVENAFFAQMGAQLTNTSAIVACSSNALVPQSSIRPHQVTAGLTGLAIPCAAGINLGPNDYALVYDPLGTTIVGAVAKIDLTPLPVTPDRVPSSRPRATIKANGAASPPAIDGVNHPRP